MIKMEVMAGRMVASGNGEDMSVMEGRMRKIGTRSRVNWFATFNLLPSLRCREIQMKIQTQIQVWTQTQIQLHKKWVSCSAAQDCFAY